MTEQLRWFLSWEVIGLLGWFVAPWYGRWAATWPIPRFITGTPPESFTLIARAISVMGIAVGFSAFSWGWIVIIGVALGAWGLTAWRYRTPRP